MNMYFFKKIKNESAYMKKIPIIKPIIFLGYLNYKLLLNLNFLELIIF